MKNGNELIHFNESEKFLDISKYHLELISRSKNKEISIPGKKIDHSIISIIFSAISVESSINFALKVPLLLISQNKIQEFYGKLSVSFGKISIPEKLKFIKQLLPKNRNNANLLKSIEELFKPRNRLVHSSYVYQSPTGKKCYLPIEDEN